MAKKPVAPAQPDDEALKEARQTYRDWVDEIEAAKKHFADYFKRCRNIVKLYKDERKKLAEEDSRNGQSRMNILWSNMETLKPATYSRTPAPNASRRFMDKDPVSRTAALIMERNLVTAIDLCDFDYPMKRVRDDYLLVARGVPWVRFAPTMGMVPSQIPVTLDEAGSGYRDLKGTFVEAGKVKDDDETGPYYEGEDEEQILTYGLAVDHILWSHFLHEPVNDWSKCGWIAKLVEMKRPALIKNFGKNIGRKIKLTHVFRGGAADTDQAIGSDSTSTSDQRRGKPNCAHVWEIWSEAERKVTWISSGYEDGPLKEQPDPLKLQQFWPVPRPAYGTLSTDSLIPVPDYSLYQDQANQLDDLTNRIRIIIKAIRVVGAYNAAIATLGQILSEAEENEMIPVDDWLGQFSQTNGLKGNIDWLPIDQFAAVLKILFEARAQIKQDLYEVSGLSDVMRGVSDPSETATAQDIKQNWGSMRTKERQGEMARVAKDTLRIMGEVQCEHYDDNALIEMSGITGMDEFSILSEQPPAADPQNPQALQDWQAKRQAAQSKITDAIALLRSDKMRTFKIDMETDATVAPDQDKEKQARVEFLQAVAPFLDKAVQVGTAAPQYIPMLLEMLQFGVRGFRAGRSLEASIEETVDTAKKMLDAAQANPNGGQPPDPEAQAAADKLKAETDKLNHELQVAQADAQAKAQENQARVIEMQRRSEEQRQQFQQQMLQLTEELQFRRLENEKRIEELNASIELKRLQILQVEGQQGLAELKQLATPQPGVTPLEDAQNKAATARAHADLAEQQTRYAELMQRGKGLDGMMQTLGEMPEHDPSKIGTPAFAKKPSSKKRLIGFIRHPETNALMGATVDELEVPDDPDQTQEPQEPKESAA